MKKITLLLISTLLVFALAACSSTVSPKEVVEKGIASIKNLDIIQIQKYFNTVLHFNLNAIKYCSKAEKDISIIFGL